MRRTRGSCARDGARGAGGAADLPDPVFYLVGVAIGVLTSAPVGPVNVAAIERAARFGFVPGLVAGLGAVAADGLYATFAAFGVTAVSDFIERHADLIQTAGAILLLIFGTRILTVRPRFACSETGERGSATAAFVTGFAITATNPGVVLGFLAIFGSLGKWAPDPGDYAGAGLLVAGVVSGATGWWLLLSAGVSWFRGRLTEGWLASINRASGVALICFGLAILAHVILM